MKPEKRRKIFVYFVIIEIIALESNRYKVFFYAFTEPISSRQIKCITREVEHIYFLMLNYIFFYSFVCLAIQEGFL